MSLETGSFINDLTVTNPLSSDPAGQGDDHLRLIKATVQGTFPQMGTVFSAPRRQDVAVSISSTWNTNHFLCSNSATATVVLTLPPAASITAGFYVDITTIGTGTVSLLPSGAASINGGVSLSIPRLNTARAYFLGGTAWQAMVQPHGAGGNIFGGNVVIDGTLTVSGATALAAVSISGNATLLGTLSLSGAATLGSTLSVSGATALAALTVNGVCTMSAAVHMKSTLSISGAVAMATSLTVGTNLTVSGTTTISGTLVLSIGQIAFPASQVTNAGANVLDDYEEGSFTPVLSCEVVGTFALGYASRSAVYTKVGRVCHCRVSIVLNAYFAGTGSGNLIVTGFPFNAAAQSVGALLEQGVATGTDQYLTAVLSNAGATRIYACNVNTGAAYTALGPADINSTTAEFHFDITFEV